MGLENDQYIDWYEGGRTYLFDFAAAFNSAIWTNSLSIPASQGGGLPQPDVTPLQAAALPKCQAWDGNEQLLTCSLKLKETKIAPPTGIPFQLQEITWASPIGPPLNNTLPGPYHTNTGLEWVNFNVSSLDSVFLPVAMGPLDTTDPQNFPIQGVGVKSNWVGSSQNVSQFRKAILNFSNSGNGWPFFIPTYFDNKAHAGFPSSTSYACSLAPFPRPTTILLPMICRWSLEPLMF